MKTELGIAYAQIKGGFEHDSHGFHIFFDQSSTVPCFYLRDFSYPFLSTKTGGVNAKPLHLLLFLPKFRKKLRKTRLLTPF